MPGSWEARPVGEVNLKDRRLALIEHLLCAGPFPYLITFKPPHRAMNIVRWGKLHSERSFSSKVTQSWSQYLDIGPLHCRARLHSVHCCILEGKNNKKDPSILYQQYVPTHPRTFTPAVAYVWNMLSSLCLALSQTWYGMYLTSRVTWALTN